MATRMRTIKSPSDSGMRRYKSIFEDLECFNLKARVIRKFKNNHDESRHPEHLTFDSDDIFYTAEVEVESLRELFEYIRNEKAKLDNAVELNSNLLLDNRRLERKIADYEAYENNHSFKAFSGARSVIKELKIQIQEAEDKLDDC